jgi:hypothetical protein
MPASRSNTATSTRTATISAWRPAGSVFLGVDTVLGPVYLAYGHAEQGNDSIYLYLGRLS